MEKTEEMIRLETIKQANLLLDGMSLKQIADEYKSTKAIVNYNLTTRLKKYDPELYTRVLVELEKRDKELVISQANMYLNGDPLSIVGFRTDQHRFAVSKNFKEKLKGYDPDLYEKVMARLAENKNQPVVLQGSVEVAFKTCKLFIEKDMSTEDIAILLHIPGYVVKNILTKNLEMYHKFYPQYFTDEMVEAIKEKVKVRASLPQINLDMLNRMYPTEEKRKKFIINCALAFGLRLEALNELFAIDKDQIYVYLTKDVNYCENSLRFLFNHGFVYQEQAIAEFKDFFARLSNASLANDRNACLEILNEISDVKATNFKKKHRKGDKISDDDLLALLKYQLKYGLSMNTMEKVFNININNYARRVEALEDKYPQLYSYYIYITDFYHNLYLGSTRNG